MGAKILKDTIQTIVGPRIKLALIVRGDLKMSKGKTAAQCAHAAVICCQRAQNADSTQRRLLNTWYGTGQTKIVLRIDTYIELLELQYLAEEAHVCTAVVRDAGQTQLKPGTATVLGIGPDEVDKIDKLVAHLKLL